MTRAEMEGRIESLERMLDEARAESDRYQEAVRWALGEHVHGLPPFPERPPNGPAFWWRRGLRAAAFERAQ